MPGQMRYAGTWVDGRMEGRGVATYAGGDVYDGEFVDGRREGQGTLTYASGEVLAGIWKNGALAEQAQAAAPEDEPDPVISDP
ncbi:MAG: hypothetical protein AAGC86_06045 [Pseudomonadota bacterium]